MGRQKPEKVGKSAKNEKKMKKLKSSIDLALKTSFFPTLFLNYKLI